MNRPEISVVMPFAGSRAEADAAVAALRSLRTSAGDELILVDNQGSVTGADGVTVVQAEGERSPAHARNQGAARAGNGWILFLDADCRPSEALLDAYFAADIAEDVGAVAGEVRPAPGEETLVARYGAARSFLGQQAHLEHPFRPRAAAANLLVRRSAFEQVGGFFEGVRAAEDTDFTWRLQQAGWRLDLRPQAWAEHRYRTTLRDLRRQWRGYAAGRAWLSRRYEGFQPHPALARAWQRSRARLSGPPAPPRSAAAGHGARTERGRFLALDALLSVDELVGFALSNRPPPSRPAPSGPPQVLLVADRFPAREDPLVELALTLDRARVEALARPGAPDVAALRRLETDYVEDDGLAARLSATVALVVRHPLRCLQDRLHRAPDDIPMLALAPAVLRLERDAGTPVRSLGGKPARRLAERLAALAGRELGG